MGRPKHNLGSGKQRPPAPRRRNLLEERSQIKPIETTGDVSGGELHQQPYIHGFPRVSLRQQTTPPTGQAMTPQLQLKALDYDRLSLASTPEVDSCAKSQKYSPMQPPEGLQTKTRGGGRNALSGSSCDTDIICEASSGGNNSSTMVQKPHIRQGREPRLKQGPPSMGNRVSASSGFMESRHQSAGTGRTTYLGAHISSPGASLRSMRESTTRSSKCRWAGRKRYSSRENSAGQGSQIPHVTLPSGIPRTPNAPIHDVPPAEAQPAEGQSRTKLSMDEGSQASSCEASTKRARKNARAISWEDPPTTDSPGLPLVRTRGRVYKTKELRGKFDLGAMKRHLGVDLSPDRAQRLKTLSGNHMSTAVNLYLQGYCDNSKCANDQIPDSPDGQQSVPQRRRTSKKSAKPTRLSLSQGQSQLQEQDLSLESARGGASHSSAFPRERGALTTAPVSRHPRRALKRPLRVVGTAGDAKSLAGTDSTRHRPSSVSHRQSSTEINLAESVDQQDQRKSCCSRYSGCLDDCDVKKANSGLVNRDDDNIGSNHNNAEANDEHSGPGPVPHRGIQSFTNQENVRPRNPPSNTSRVPNGKPGTAPGWGAFGMPMGAAPGLQTIQQRTLAGGSGMASFSLQNAAGSQPSTPLDPSEFPSLSGAPQTQQNPGQAIWAQRPNQPGQSSQSSQTQRAAQSQASQPTPLQTQPSSQSAHEDFFSPTSLFPAGLGDYGSSSQLPASNQPQTGSIDEFPPLGREVSSGLGQERRESVPQNNAFGRYGASLAFAGMTQQSRNPLSSALDRERMASPAGSGMDVLSSSRSPNPAGPNGSAGQEKLGTIGSGAENQNRQGEFASQASKQHHHQSSQLMNSAFGGNDLMDSAAIQQAGPQSGEKMSEVDQYGLAGLLATMHHPSPDVRSLSGQGQDLTTLGLDLTCTEPLHSQLASVFNPNAHTRLPLEADYTLPSCYRVANVQPLHERIPSFSEETLFYIFYSSPKDLVQELVADELIGRKWRFHKGEKMWVTRDENYPAPMEVEREISEQGFYIWWDWKGWKKVRRQYILRYEDLDNGTTRSGAGSTLNQMALNGTPGALAQATGVFSR